MKRALCYAGALRAACGTAARPAAALRCLSGSPPSEPRFKSRRVSGDERFPPPMPKDERMLPLGVDLSRVDIEKPGADKKDFDYEKLFEQAEYSPLSFPTPYTNARTERDRRLRKVVAKYEKRRMALKAIVYNQHLHEDVRFHAQQFLMALPRDSSKTRVVNRCNYNGQARSVWRKFAMNRMTFRRMANEGLIPGVTRGHN